MTYLNKSCQFQQAQELQIIRGKRTRSRRLPPYWWKVKRPSKNFRLKKKDSGSKSGSREICLPQSSEALKSGLKFWLKKNIISRKFEFSGKAKRLPKRICCHDARFKHEYPALWVYLDHLGASCANIGRIRTKENIAVDTLLIGAMPNPVGGLLIIFES